MTSATTIASKPRRPPRRRRVVVGVLTTLLTATLLAPSGPAQAVLADTAPDATARDRAARTGLVATTAATTTSRRPPRYHSAVARVSRGELGKSWHRGCPVPVRHLRRVTVTFHGFDRKVHHGDLVVHTTMVYDVRRIFQDLYRQGFQIRRMKTIDLYGGSDARSMRWDNTSAFNCRTIAGTNRWSRHAYGKAIDVNPIENPYVRGGTVEPDAGRDYLDRRDRRRGMLVAGSAAVRAFTSRGLDWGGSWSSPKDYQHVER